MTNFQFTMNKQIVIRELAEADCPVIARAFEDQGWDKPVSQYLRYYQEHLEGKRTNLVAIYEGQFAGYVMVVWKSDYPPFQLTGIPEIVDFNVLSKYRRLGIGSALMDAAEQCAATHSPVVGLGICLHVDYGAAQVLYARRGYVPDGRGVFYRDHHPEYWEMVEIRDDLALYLTKRLNEE